MGARSPRDARGRACRIPTQATFDRRKSKGGTRSVQGSVVDNRYDIVRPLGSGGMGEVYLARDRTLGRAAAPKVLRSQYAGDRESAERFKREATSAAGLAQDRKR